MQRLWFAFDFVRRTCRQLAPYVAIALLVPGGTLVAVALFVHRRGGAAPALPRVRPAARVDA